MFYFLLGQSSNISLSLCHSCINSVLLASRCQLLAGLFTLQYEAVPTVQVDVPVVSIAIDSGRRDEPLKYISVLSGVAFTRVWVRKVQQRTKVSHERLEVCSFTTCVAFPAFEEFIDGRGICNEGFQANYSLALHRFY